MLICSIRPNLLFPEAAKFWLKSRAISATPGAVSARHIRQTTENSYQQYIDSLELFFRELQLEKIHLGHFSEYQQRRLGGEEPFIRKRRKQDKEAKPSPVAPKKVNQELGTLKMILKRAKLWTPEMEEFYEPLPEEDSGLPRALSAAEQQLWLDCARINPRWAVVYWYSTLAFATTMGTNEMRSLRLGDVNLQHRIVMVPREGAKNRYRERTIPLRSAEAVWAAEQLIERAKDLGAAGPIDYLFPFRASRGHFDATKPMTVSGIKKDWNEVREKTGLTWFTPYHTRHTAITRMAEAGINIATIMSYAGHMNRQTTYHYTHVSEAVQQRELDKLEAMKKPPRSDAGPAYQSPPFYISSRKHWGR